MLKRAMIDYNIPLEQIFSLELSLNVSSALKVNASVKLRLCTLYEDKIKWLSFVTIIVLTMIRKQLDVRSYILNEFNYCLLYTSPSPRDA